jgi:CubicO group peptidase (beta-lactamase class C family)
MRCLVRPCLLLGSLLLVIIPAPGQTSEKNPGFPGENLPALLEKARAKHDVPALAAGIIRADGKSQVAVVGVRKRGTDTPVAADDQWHIGSNTKPFTALLIARLIDEGVLDWDTPLEKIFPEHAEKWSDDVRKITPAHLLTHTSGLPPTGPLLGFLISRKESKPAEDRDKLVKGLEKVTMSAKPGEKYQYSNLGYCVLGAIIDKRGKATWEEQLEKKLIQPLKIKRWGLGPPDAKEAKLHPWPHPAGGKPLAEGNINDNPPVMNSAGRIRLSVADYNRFLAEVLKLARGDKGLLKPDTAQKVFTSPYPVSPHSLSGWVGFRKERGGKGLILGHNGSNTFNYCIAIVMPDQDLALCVLTNQGAPGGPGEKVCVEAQKELRSLIATPKK